MNRATRRREAAAARARRKAISRMVDRPDALKTVLELKPEVARSVLLRLAYAALKRGRVTLTQARLFGVRKTKGDSK